MVLLRQKYEAPLSIKSPEPRAKGNVDIRGGNYGKGLNKQDVNLTDRLLAIDRLSANPKGLWAMAKYGKERSTKPKDLPKFPTLKIDTNTRAKTFE